MNPQQHLEMLGDAFDETALEQPDGPEMIVLAAIRAWLRPRCDARRGQQCWHEILRSAGLHADGMKRFDMVMRSLLTVCTRPLDIRCRCATELAGDEAALLQIIALLQATHSDAAMRLLGEWLPQPATSGVIKLIPRLAIDLLDAGLDIRVRDRHVTYMH